MAGPACTGVLIYSKNVARMSTFYERVLGARVILDDGDHRVIESADLQLIVHAIPAQYSDAIEISVPPAPREDQSIKPFFTVEDLEAAARIAEECGGVACGPVWPGPGLHVRVSRPGHFSPSPSQNRTGTSRLIRLPSSSHRGISPLPMHKRPRFTFRKPTKCPCCASNATSKTLVFALQPTNQVIVHVPPKRLKRRAIESTVVVRPAPKHWSKHVREIAQRFVALKLQMPATHSLAHRPHCFATDGRREVYVQTAILIHRFARLERVTEERKFHDRILGRPIDVLTVNDSCFLRMQFESALTKPLPECLQHEPRLLFALAVDNAIISVPA